MNTEEFKTKAYKSKIYEFFRKTFGEYAYDRLKGLKKDKLYNSEDVSSFSNFIKYNENCIQKMSDDEAFSIFILCGKIKKNEILMADEEYFIDWKAYTFYFNAKGKLVLLHPR